METSVLEAPEMETLEDESIGNQSAEPDIDQHLANIERARAAAPAIREKLQQDRAALDESYAKQCGFIDAKLAQVDRMLGVVPTPAQAPKRRRGRPPLATTVSNAPKGKVGWPKGKKRGPRQPKEQ